MHVSLICSVVLRRPGRALARGLRRAGLGAAALAGLLASESKADIAFNLYGGYAPLAQLSRVGGGSAHRLSMIPVGAEAAYVLGRAGILSLHLGLGLVHGRVVYNDSGTTYAGVFNAQAGSLGVGMMFGSVQVLMQGVGLFSSSLSVRSEIHATVNDVTFKHSNLMTYRGASGALGRLVFLTEHSDKQFARNTAMRVGLAVEGLSQAFSSYTLNINTNDPNIGPGGIWSSKPNVAMTYAGVSILVGFIY